MWLMVMAIYVMIVAKHIEVHSSAWIMYIIVFGCVDSAIGINGLC